jgi:hypothetical protein
MSLRASSTLTGFPAFLDDPLIAVVGAVPEDRSNPQHGAELRPGEWVLPPEITDAMVAACRDGLRTHDAQSGPVQGGVLGQWLSNLFPTCAKRAGDCADVEAWIKSAGFALEEHPAFCFTQTSLRAAMRRFKFLPTGAELLAFADEIVTARGRAAQRAWKVMDAGPRATTAMQWGPAAAEEQARRNRAKAAKERAELAAIVGHSAAPPPERLPGEDDKAFVSRLASHARSLCDAGKRGLRRDEAANRQRKAGPTAAELDASRKAAADALARRSAATPQPDADASQVDQPAEPAAVSA